MTSLHTKNLITDTPIKNLILVSIYAEFSYNDLESPIGVIINHRRCIIKYILKWRIMLMSNC